ncbi:MAG: UPF0149 family protein [Holosporaceae bacterium]|jgi:uncharacterized protein|nr:UPF0149 family protein [Holosporaceae bacterium]
MSHNLQNIASTIFSDDEINELSDMLFLLPKFEAMSLEILNGFLAALSCSPREVSLNEYIHMIVGNSDAKEELPFDDEEQTNRFIDLLTRYQNHIDNLMSNGNFEPHLELKEDNSENDFSTGVGWSLGFMACISSINGEFAPLLNDEENGDILLPMLMLTFSEQDIPEMAEIDKHLTPEIKYDLVSQLGASAMAVYNYFHANENDDSNNFCRDNSSEECNVCCSSKMVH